MILPQETTFHIFSGMLQKWVWWLCFSSKLSRTCYYSGMFPLWHVKERRSCILQLYIIILCYFHSHGKGFHGNQTCITFFKKMISRRMTKLLSWCGNMVLNGGRSLLSISRGGLANSAVKGTYPCYSSSLMKYLSCLWLIKANNIAFSLCGTIQVQ